ncbi:pseudouridine synthase [Vulgatibacter sp.]|uniref:pseudouridine synthase n=1 Tax=Vulgatibacter sp. TaxID=1971226 RepID=UPI0035698EA8
MAEERLQKILSRSGIASRRAAEELILAGRVEVNGKKVLELGSRADPRRDLIRVDEQVIAEPEELAYYVLYKPERVVTTLSDPEGRQAVGDLLRRVNERVYPVGRLDYDAEGVLLLTNDGELAHKLTHPRWGVRRTYLAKVKGDPADAVLERMREGVRLEDGMARAIEATWEKRTPKNTWIRLVVAEGRHHLVKRLCEAVGHPVVRLFRSDYAGIGFAGLRPGDVRPLSRLEVQALRKAVEKEAPPPPGGIRRKRPRAGAGAVRNPILGTAPRRNVTGGRSGFGAERGAGGFGAERGAGGRGAGGERGAGGRGGFGAERGAGGRGAGGERGAGGRGGFGAERGASGRGAGGERGASGRGGFAADRGAGGRGGFGADRGAGTRSSRGETPAGGERLGFARWADEEGFAEEPSYEAPATPRKQRGPGAGRPQGGARAAGGGSRGARGAQTGGGPRSSGGRPRGPARGPSREGGRGGQRRGR